MNDMPLALRRPFVDDVDFVNLDGDCGSFDISEAVGTKQNGEEDVWYGRDFARCGDQALYRLSDKRWVLVFVNLPRDEGQPSESSLNRELTSDQAARWLRLNSHGLPTGLRLTSLIDDDERQAGQARLDRDWKPLKRPDSETPATELPSVPPNDATSEPPPDDISAEPPPDDISAEPPLDELDAESPAHISDSPAVILGRPEDDPIVRGKHKEPLTRARYDVVKAILVAGRNLRKDELDTKSGHSDARKLLKSLANSDPDWKAVIVFPSGYGTGHGITHAWLHDCTTSPHFSPPDFGFSPRHLSRVQPRHVLI